MCFHTLFWYGIIMFENFYLFSVLPIYKYFIEGMFKRRVIVMDIQFSYGDLRLVVTYLAILLRPG